MALSCVCKHSYIAPLHHLLPAGLISHVWQQVVAAIHNAEPLNEGTIGDMFEEACEVPNVSCTRRLVHLPATAPHDTKQAILCRHLSVAQNMLL